MSASHSMGENVSTGVVCPPQRTRIIHSCNFRYAGRLSNENARFLTALHEKFALNVTNALELYLGASLQLKLVSLEQLAITDYIAGIAPNSYLLPCAIDVMDSNSLIEIDVALIFPIIDLLLGGSGDSGEQHELTEIDEEIVESVSSLVIRELERSWRSLNLTLTAGRCIKAGMIQQIFPVNEKLVLLMFEMTIGATTGSFNIVLPTPFVGFLLRHLKATQSKKVAGRLLHGPTLKERILDCDFALAADVTQMRVLVRDLVDLKPGMVLKTTAPVKDPGCLTVEGVEIFQAMAVRNGALKAAQITAKLQEPPYIKD